MRLVLGEINPKILLILSSLLVLIALYSFKGKAETVYYFYDVEKPTGTIQKPKIRILVNRDEQKNHVYGRSRKFKNFHSRAYRLKSHLENRFSKSVSLKITESYIILCAEVQLSKSNDSSKATVGKLFSWKILILVGN